MTDTETRELMVKEKQEARATGEQTRPGSVFSPEVDIFESDTEITLLADMPGVTTENLTVDLRDDVLTLTGDASCECELMGDPLVIEYGAGTYYRQFTLSDVIDQTKIRAELKDGVLRLVLPKVLKATPRTITVSAG